MSKIFKLLSQNKKNLFLIGLGLILFLIPLQSAKAQNEVCVYMDPNYASVPICWTSESSVPLLDIPNLVHLNNTLSSVKITGSFSAWLYEDAEFGGRYICFTTSTPNLGAFALPGATNGDTWNDNASSLEIRPATDCTSPGVTQGTQKAPTQEFCPGCSWLNPAKCIWCVVEYLFSLPIRIGFFVLILPIVLTALFAGLLYAVVVAICNWMTYIAMRVGITPANPITPQVVTIGWTFSRDFVNMFFILILVFIGLATILKIREYEAKKILPKLIIIALLINFTPVIVGFIVDIGNIVTNFLLSRAAQIMSLPAVLNMIWNYFTTTLTTIFTINGEFFEKFVTILGTFIGIIVYGVVVTIFFLLGSWIYFLVMLIFLLRIVELWILMILSPIAFFSHILPSGSVEKKIFPSILHWDRWWEEFLQWILVGIPLGLFLYLSNWIMVNTPVVENIFQNTTVTVDSTVIECAVRDPITNLIISNNCATIEACKNALYCQAAGASGFGAGLEAQFISLITSILAPTVALVLLYKGYKIAKETAPAAARGIIEGVTKLGQVAVAAGITAATMGAGAGVAAGVVGKVAAGAQRLEAFVGGRESLKIRGREIKPPPGVIGKPLEYLAAKPIKWATRGVEMVAAPPLLEYAAKARRVEIPPEFEKMTPKEQVQYARVRALTPQAKIQYKAKMVDLKTFDEAIEKDKKFKEESGELAGRFIEGPYSKEAQTVQRALPDTMEEKVLIKAKLAGKVTEEERKKVRDEITKEIDKMAEEISKDEKAQPEIRTRAALKYNVAEDKVTAEMMEKVTRDMSAAAIYTKEIKPEDVPKITKDSAKSLAVRMGSLYWDGRHLSKATEKFGPEFVEAYMEEVERKGPEWFVANNPRGLLYLSGNAAQDFGYTTPRGWSREKVKEAIRYSRGKKEGRGEEERPPYIV